MPRAAGVNEVKVFVGSQISRFSDNIAPVSVEAIDCDFRVYSPVQVQSDIVGPSDVEYLSLDSSMDLSLSATNSDHNTHFPLTDDQPEVAWFQSPWSPPTPQSSTPRSVRSNEPSCGTPLHSMSEAAIPVRSACIMTIMGCPKTISMLLCKSMVCKTLTQMYPNTLAVFS